MDVERRFRVTRNSAQVLVGVICLCLTAGCWAPFRSSGVPACTLPDDFRTPMRVSGPPLCFASLTMKQTGDYVLGANDVLEVTIEGLYTGADTEPFQTQVMDSGEVILPIVGPVLVGGLNLQQAQQAIVRTFADGVLKSPRINLTIAQKATMDIVVLGEVKSPGTYPLPRLENDVGHALAIAGGLTYDASMVVEVHRGAVDPQSLKQQTIQLEQFLGNPADPDSIMRIPLRGISSELLTENDITLHPGDVVVVPNRKHEVFFVVGRTANLGRQRFSYGERERELGVAIILPRDREIDVVTAVTMAGYIDPIHSPTTVTVHRMNPPEPPLLIHVDLIKARFDARETVLVLPGDIIYMNPDFPWYFRTTFDRVVEGLILVPYAKAVSSQNLGSR